MPARFADKSRPTTVNYMINVDVGTAKFQVDSYAFVKELYSADYSERWKDIGYLACFIAGLQLFHLYATRFKQHIDR